MSVLKEFQSLQNLNHYESGFSWSVRWHSLQGGSPSSCPALVSLEKALDVTLIQGLYTATPYHEMRIPVWLLNTP